MIAKLLKSGDSKRFGDVHTSIGHSEVKQR